MVMLSLRLDHTLLCVCFELQISTSKLLSLYWTLSQIKSFFCEFLDVMHVFKRIIL